MSYKIKAKKYWFILTDVGGWDLATDKVRDFKISSVLDEGFETTDILYKMYIHKLGDISSMSTLWIDLSRKLMWVSLFTPPFKFRCESLEEAEEIIDGMLEQNSLVVAPANLIE